MSFNRDYVQVFDVDDYLSSTSRVRASNKRNLMVTPCPVCGETKPHKFYVRAEIGSEHNGRWNSYCCHNAGDLVSLVYNAEGYASKAEAVAHIKAVVDGDDDGVIPLIETVKANAADAEELLPCSFPVDLFEASPEMIFVRDGNAHSLRSRGVDEYIITRHMLRVTGNQTTYEGKWRPDLNNRLIIPVLKTGQTLEWLSWQGRDLTGMAERKYVFPTNDKSSRTLYGYEQAKTMPMMIVVEGAFHKWAFDSLGKRLGNQLIENCAVASFGKKLSPEQEELIVNSTAEKVVLAWDLDAAPQIHRIAQRLHGRKQVYVMEASQDGRDHDELTDVELLTLMANIKPYTYQLAVEMNARLALMKEGAI